MPLSLGCLALQPLQSPLQGCHISPQSHKLRAQLLLTAALLGRAGLLRGVGRHPVGGSFLQRAGSFP